MTWTTQPPKERTAEGDGLSGHLLALLASLAGYLRARFELAGIEGKDAAGRFISAAIFLGVAVGFLAFGYAFAWIGVIALIAIKYPQHWGWIVLGAGALHFVGAAVCACIIRSLCKKPVFEATLEEFKKDQEWLNSQI